MLLAPTDSFESRFLVCVGIHLLCRIIRTKSMNKKKKKYSILYRICAGGSFVSLLAVSAIETSGKSNTVYSYSYHRFHAIFLKDKIFFSFSGISHSPKGPKFELTKERMELCCSDASGSSYSFFEWT